MVCASCCENSESDGMLCCIILYYTQYARAGRTRYSNLPKLKYIKSKSDSALILQRTAKQQYFRRQVFLTYFAIVRSRVCGNNVFSADRYTE